MNKKWIPILLIAFLFFVGSIFSPAFLFAQETGATEVPIQMTAGSLENGVESSHSTGEESAMAAEIVPQKETTVLIASKEDLLVNQVDDVDTPDAIAPQTETNAIGEGTSVIDDSTENGTPQVTAENQDPMPAEPPLPAPAENPVAIYLNGIDGNDAHDGTTKELAVKTFEKAKQLASELQSITTIYVTGTVPISDEISLQNTNAILQRDANFDLYLLRVDKGQTATLANITVDGNFENAPTAFQSLIQNLGTLHITEGTVLQNNQIASPTKRTHGGAVYANGGTVNMSGGMIQNNSATMGGGIYLAKNAALNMSGGTIQNNNVMNGPEMTAWNDAAAGGGICLVNGGKILISDDAAILNNYSDEVGGGISIGSLEASLGDNKLIMTGGKIDGNSSGATGGGIFVQAGYSKYQSTANITAGYITNNHMLGTGETNFAFGGGGIYVNGYTDDITTFNNGHVMLENVVITDNSALLQGGGYAACPVSNTKIYLTDGGAIYGNKNELNNVRDIYILSAWTGYGAHGGNPDYRISERMLGGVPYHWKNTDGIEFPLDKLSGTLIGEHVAIELNTDEEGNENTDALAKVFISGNTSATRGGGIGSNGDVTIGKPDETVNISIEKIWNDEANQLETRPESINVELFYNLENSENEPEYLGYVRVQPDENGNWSVIFDNLPKYDGNGNPYVYSINEKYIPGYTHEITGTVEDGFTITNTLTEKIKILVEKVWKDNENAAGIRSNDVTVQLLADGKETDMTLVLNAENEWKGMFSDLEEFLEGVKIAYTVREVEIPSGYTVGITGNMAEGFIITNTRKPDKPDKPDEPNEPEKPTEPEQPEEPTEPENPEEPQEPVVPETPNEPTKPEIPQEPVKPIVPETPNEPTKPEPPIEPMKPQAPSVPEKMVPVIEQPRNVKAIPQTGANNAIHLVWGFMVLSLTPLMISLRNRRSLAPRNSNET